MQSTGTYKADLGDIQFLLWQQFRAQDEPLVLGDLTRDDVDDILRTACDFAVRRLGPTYQTADREGCRLENGEVRVPSVFPSLWADMREAQWPLLGAPREYGGLEAPFVVTHAVNELFVGANPSFMIYSGFGIPVLRLILAYGDERLRSLFAERLARADWTACFCVTEPDAGSDVGMIRARARRRPDGTYLIEGTKIFISAGMHSLAPNIVYVVLARTEGAPAGTAGLSCFIVPRFRVLPTGELGEDNDIRCTRVESKMGLHGAATTELVFGASGRCEGYLLGAERRGLTQLLPLMNVARIATANFALGMASSAYLNAAHYASQRLQGTNVRQSFNPNAPRVPIIEHLDVRRMLLEMKSKVEGCRALLTKLSMHQSVVYAGSDRVPEADYRRHRIMVDLLTPVAKAYISDQAWRVAELAIQVYGGHGYISDHPVEQYARDIKIMSIWEGTNFIQSADLVRDQLGMGRATKNLACFSADIDRFVHENATGEFANDVKLLGRAFEAVLATNATFAAWLRDGRMEHIFGVSTRFLEMLAEVTVAALLLDGAIVASRAAINATGEAQRDFYRGKVLAATFYVRNVLPHVLATHDVIASADDSVIEANCPVFVR